MARLGCNFTGGLKKGAESAPSQLTDLCDLKLIEKYAILKLLFNIRASRSSRTLRSCTPTVDFLYWLRLQGWFKSVFFAQKVDF